MTDTTTKKQETSRWPTREVWARQQRWAGNYDMPPMSHKIADYATPAEIQGWLLALRERGKELSREMKRLGGKDADAARYLRERHRTLNEEIRCVKGGTIPDSKYNCASSDAREILVDLLLRWDAAHKQAWDEFEIECSTRPIDDDAWSAELQRRASLDRKFASARRR